MAQLKRWTSLNLIPVIGTCLLLLLLLAVPAYGEPLEVQWYNPYFNHEASLVLPVDDKVETSFNFQARLDDKYSAVLVRAVYSTDEVYYYYPADNGIVAGVVYLRFGQGR